MCCKADVSQHTAYQVDLFSSVHHIVYFPLQLVVHCYGMATQWIVSSALYLLLFSDQKCIRMNGVVIILKTVCSPVSFSITLHHLELKHKITCAEAFKQLSHSCVYCITGAQEYKRLTSDFVERICGVSASSSMLKPRSCWWTLTGKSISQPHQLEYRKALA